MPNPNFTSFLANYRSAIICKKIRFCIPKTVLNFSILRVLLMDGYIRSFRIVGKKFEITCINLQASIKFNWLITYSSPKWIVFLTFNELITLTKTGGYFVLSTQFGVMNDSNARKLWVGGVLLFAIF